jgi:hypothetical protein
MISANKPRGSVAPTTYSLVMQDLHNLDCYDDYESEEPTLSWTIAFVVWANSESARPACESNSRGENTVPLPLDASLQEDKA